jgi:hypothetical protein
VGDGNNIMLKNECKKVSVDVVVGDYINSPSKLVIHSLCYLLVLDVNGLLCDAKHVKYSTRWRPLIHLERCGNKIISPRPHVFEFLQHCSQKFDIGIWSSTIRLNLVPMVEYLFWKVEGLKLMFLWGDEKCEHTHICHPLNVNRELVLKNMKRVWEEINLTFNSLGPHNKLLIDDCMFKCIGNMPFLYNLPMSFNLEVENNYLMNTFWPYLKGLSKAPNTIGYMGSNPHG